MLSTPPAFILSQDRTLNLSYPFQLSTGFFLLFFLNFHSECRFSSADAFSFGISSLLEFSGSHCCLVVKVLSFVVALFSDATLTYYHSFPDESRHFLKNFYIFFIHPFAPCAVGLYNNIISQNLSILKIKIKFWKITLTNKSCLCIITHASNAYTIVIAISSESGEILKRLKRRPC